MIPVFRNIDSPNGDFGLVKQEGDERFAVLTVEEYAALREADARANTAKVAADLMRARAERAEGLLRDARPYMKRLPFDLAKRIDDALGEG